MYGRADGMPSFQLTVAVCAYLIVSKQYITRVCRSWAVAPAPGFVLPAPTQQRDLPFSIPPANAALNYKTSRSTHRRVLPSGTFIRRES